MNIKLKDITNIDTIISICDIYISLYDREIFDSYLYSKISLSNAFPSFLGEKLFEIINKRAIEELQPYITGYENYLDGYYELVPTHNFSDFREKHMLVKEGCSVSYYDSSLIEYGEDITYFKYGNNPWGLSLSSYCPSFFVESGISVYQDMFSNDDISLQNMNEQELYNEIFPCDCDIQIVPEILIQQFHNDCLHSEDDVTYIVRTSKSIPAFERWDSEFDASKDNIYRILARESIKDLKSQDYMYLYIGMDDIYYSFEDKETYYDIRRIFYDTYCKISADDRYIYPDVFFKNLKLEVLITYLNNKYHFYSEP